MHTLYIYRSRARSYQGQVSAGMDYRHMHTQVSTWAPVIETKVTIKIYDEILNARLDFERTVEVCWQSKIVSYDISGFSWGKSDPGSGVYSLPENVRRFVEKRCFAIPQVSRERVYSNVVARAA